MSFQRTALAGTTTSIPACHLKEPKAHVHLLQHRQTASAPSPTSSTSTTIPSMTSVQDQALRSTEQDIHIHPRENPIARPTTITLVLPDTMTTASQSLKRHRSPSSSLLAAQSRRCSVQVTHLKLAALHAHPNWRRRIIRPSPAVILISRDQSILNQAARPLMAELPGRDAGMDHDQIGRRILCPGFQSQRSM